MTGSSRTQHCLNKPKQNLERIFESSLSVTNLSFNSLWACPSEHGTKRWHCVVDGGPNLCWPSKDASPEYNSLFIFAFAIQQLSSLHSAQDTLEQRIILFCHWRLQHAEPQPAAQQQQHKAMSVCLLHSSFEQSKQQRLSQKGSGWARRCHRRLGAASPPARSPDQPQPVMKNKFSSFYKKNQHSYWSYSGSCLPCVLVRLSLHHI